MRTPEDIVKRVRHLEKTLIWQSAPPGEVGQWQLISTDTKRIVARIVAKKDGTEFRAFNSVHGREDSCSLFFEEGGAKDWLKFWAIKDILSEDLRRAYVQ